MTSPEEFRDTHGDYTTWTNETYDLYFALLADNAATLTQQTTTPAPATIAAA
ncbi:hypothetical protein [Streptomyces sp. NPDC047868]|uniref:hypothetical protein n=1 Tax=Streptomyces sp. NPDC047868 TaxID=3155480 RepID=UPI0034566127